MNPIDLTLFRRKTANTQENMTSYFKCMHAYPTFVNASAILTKKQFICRLVESDIIKSPSGSILFFHVSNSSNHHA